MQFTALMKSADFIFFLLSKSVKVGGNDKGISSARTLKWSKNFISQYCDYKTEVMQDLSCPSPHPLCRARQGWKQDCRWSEVVPSDWSLENVTLLLVKAGFILFGSQTNRWWGWHPFTRPSSPTCVPIQVEATLSADKMSCRGTSRQIQACLGKQCWDSLGTWTDAWSRPQRSTHGAQQRWF